MAKDPAPPGYVAVSEESVSDEDIIEFPSTERRSQRRYGPYSNRESSSIHSSQASVSEERSSASAQAKSSSLVTGSFISSRDIQSTVSDHDVSILSGLASMSTSSSRDIQTATVPITSSSSASSSSSEETSTSDDDDEKEDEGRALHIVSFVEEAQAVANSIETSRQLLRQPTTKAEKRSTEKEQLSQPVSPSIAATEEEEKAVIKIQSCFRGYQVRGSKKGLVMNKDLSESMKKMAGSYLENLQKEIEKPLYRADMADRMPAKGSKAMRRKSLGGEVKEAVEDLGLPIPKTYAEQKQAKLLLTKKAQLTREQVEATRVTSKHNKKIDLNSKLLAGVDPSNPLLTSRSRGAVRAKLDALRMDVAARKLQALFRGHRTRTLLRKEKSEAPHTSGKAKGSRKPRQRKAKNHRSKMDISRSSGCNLEGTEDDESTVLREGVSHLHLNGGKTEPVSAVEVAMDSGADLTEALKRKKQRMREKAERRMRKALAGEQKQKPSLPNLPADAPSPRGSSPSSSVGSKPPRPERASFLPRTFIPVDEAKEGIGLSGQQHFSWNKRYHALKQMVETKKAEDKIKNKSVWDRSELKPIWCFYDIDGILEGTLLLMDGYRKQKDIDQPLTLAQFIHCGKDQKLFQTYFERRNYRECHRLLDDYYTNLVFDFLRKAQEQREKAALELQRHNRAAVSRQTLRSSHSGGSANVPLSRTQSAQGLPSRRPTPDGTAYLQSRESGVQGNAREGAGGNETRQPEAATAAVDVWAQSEEAEQAMAAIRRAVLQLVLFCLTIARSAQRVDPPLTVDLLRSAEERTSATSVGYLGEIAVRVKSKALDQNKNESWQDGIGEREEEVAAEWEQGNTASSFSEQRQDGEAGGFAGFRNGIGTASVLSATPERIAFEQERERASLEHFFEQAEGEDQKASHWEDMRRQARVEAIDPTYDGDAIARALGLREPPELVIKKVQMQSNSKKLSNFLTSFDDNDIIAAAEALHRESFFGDSDEETGEALHYVIEAEKIRLSLRSMTFDCFAEYFYRRGKYSAALQFMSKSLNTDKKLPSISPDVACARIQHMQACLARLHRRDESLSVATVATRVMTSAYQYAAELEKGVKAEWGVPGFLHPSCALIYATALHNRGAAEMELHDFDSAEDTARKLFQMIDDYGTLMAASYVKKFFRSVDVLRRVTTAANREGRRRWLRKEGKFEDAKGEARNALLKRERARERARLLAINAPANDMDNSESDENNEKKSRKTRKKRKVRLPKEAAERDAFEVTVNEDGTTVYRPLGRMRDEEIMRLVEAESEESLHEGKGSSSRREASRGAQTRGDPNESAKNKKARMPHPPPVRSVSARASAKPAGARETRPKSAKPDVDGEGAKRTSDSAPTQDGLVHERLYSLAIDRQRKLQEENQKKTEAPVHLRKLQDKKIVGRLYGEWAELKGVGQCRRGADEEVQALVATTESYFENRKASFKQALVEENKRWQRKVLIEREERRKQIEEERAQALARLQSPQWGPARPFSQGSKRSADWRSAESPKPSCVFATEEGLDETKDKREGAKSFKENTSDQLTRRLDDLIKQRNDMMVVQLVDERSDSGESVREPDLETAMGSREETVSFED